MATRDSLLPRVVCFQACAAGNEYKNDYALKCAHKTVILASKIHSYVR